MLSFTIYFLPSEWCKGILFQRRDNIFVLKILFLDVALLIGNLDQNINTLKKILK